MNISYYVLDPTSNITILAETPVPVELQPSVASRLMLAEPEAEQTGFLSHEPGCDIALRMAGGEFCGNAAMSAAVIAATRKGEESSTAVDTLQAHYLSWNPVTSDAPDFHRPEDFGIMRFT